MKIKRIIAAVMALVLVGGAYPSKAVNNANSIKAYAADAASEKKEDNVGVTFVDENAPSFSVEGDTYKKRENYSIKVKNVDPSSVTFGGQNYVEVSRTSAEDGSLVFTFTSKSSGEAQIIINYAYDGEIRHKEFLFNILEEEYEDENFPRFTVDESTTYMRREPYSIKVQNVDADSISFSNQKNIFEVSRTTDSDGSLVLTFLSKEAGAAYITVNYGFDGEIRNKDFSFHISNDEYEEEETTPATGLKGDANCDGSVDMGDVVLIMQALANPNKYGVNGTHELHITQEGIDNCDVDTSVKGLTVSDALMIQKYLLGGIDTL